jgi:3-oxoacyl-[acyl-carrier-protein] synthase-3
MHDHFVKTAKIVGLGSDLPERVLTNRELESMVETSDEWITTRTGISERRVVAEDEALADLVVRAARAAMRDAEVEPDEIDLMVLATETEEQPFPATAAIVQPTLGLVRAACFDISAACSGFTYALNVARQFIATGEAETVLVVGAECLTRFVDWTDRSTCVLFGDGAGAAVLKPGEPGEGILHIKWRTDGNYADLITMPGGGSRFPPHSTSSIEQRLPFIKMRGNETFKVAVRSLTEISREVMIAAGIGVEDIDLFIPHQANMRIIQAVGSRLGLADDQVFTNVERVGNTSAASIPLAMVDARRQGRLEPGSLVLTSAFGAGLTWASSLIRF